MNIIGFRQFLLQRQLSAEQVEQHIRITSRMERLDRLVDVETQVRIFSESFRDLPETYYEKDKQKY